MKCVGSRAVCPPPTRSLRFRGSASIPRPRACRALCVRTRTPTAFSWQGLPHTSVRLCCATGCSEWRDRYESRAKRLQPCARAGLDRLGKHLAGLQRILTALSYQGVLARGFALVRDAAGEPVRSAGAVTTNDPLEIEFADGRVPAVATGGTATRKRRNPDKRGQGSLF